MLPRIGAVRFLTPLGLLLLLGTFPGPLAPQGPSPQEQDASLVSQVNGPQEREGFVSVEGGRLYYREAGEGPAVILIHGGFLDHRMWDGQVQPLAGTHRVVRYDVRSHGRSAADPVPFSDMEDLRVLMDTLGIDRATLVGLSLGGQIATDFALLWPDRVESLVLVGPGLSGAPVGSSELEQYIEEIEGAWGRDDFQEVIEVFTHWFFDGPYRTPEEVDPAQRAHMLEMLSGSRERWVHSRLVRPLDPPSWERLSTIQAPTLVILGTADMPDIHMIVDHAEASIPGVERVDIEGVAHMVNMEAPSRFSEILLEFLSRH